ncbi:TetR/AcrR family transcriptional regulator [Mesobaculum littorinae]|uniref:TetR/AcrR family transcriptional regulator n=1 Tax=Mesobaculum littorinae TaxID=2486419 RepID=A0A438AF20_9RHOB|nr:TetR/AcrR family transcriptional regulator [Mesobaculum littorinae]RVV97303.1 TetR/AcrR family transcriptional regulator [Mesobaculum littorinae]
MARPRQYDRDDLKKRVILAARGLLQEGGPPALTARALAEAVGVTSGTIYAQFGGLRGVTLAVNQETFAELRAMIEALPDAPPETWLHNLAEAYVAFMLQRQGVWQALFAGPRRDEAAPEWYLRTIRALLARIAEPLGRIAPDEDAALRAEELFLAVHGVVALAAADRLDMITGRRAETLACEAVATMIRSISAGGR